eukprot:6236563-Pyramimonas_sp.AAC.1
MKSGAKVLARLFKLSGLEVAVSKQCKDGILDELCYAFQRVKKHAHEGPRCWEAQGQRHGPPEFAA